jgi:hypothetical protein
VRPIPAALLATTLAALLALQPPSPGLAPPPVPEQGQEQHAPAPGLPERVAWETDLPQAVARARELDRPLLIVFR